MNGFNFAFQKTVEVSKKAYEKTVDFTKKTIEKGNEKLKDE